ncbi:MAG: HpcH/HpaI aldolase/citrate lyase family protein [Pararhizobium sp.]
MRSYLFVPADQERKIGKALDSEADCIILDLEDSVAAGRKAVARAMARDVLLAARPERPRPALMVRVNALNTAMVEDDFEGVMEGAPAAILLPNPRSGADVQHLAALLSVHEARLGLAQESTAITALAGETATGVLSAASFAGRTPRLKALSWGAEDLAADVGASENRRKDGSYGDVFRLSRSMTLLAAADAGIEAIDTVFTDFRDEAGLEHECRAALRDGFSGKLAIHPAQLATINRVFTPGESEVERARRIVALFAEAGPEAGVLGLDGRMLDRPHLRQAERLLARAAAIRKG